MGIVIIGLVLIAVGVYLVVVKRKKIGDDLLEIQYMKTSISALKLPLLMIV